MCSGRRRGNDKWSWIERVCCVLLEQVVAMDIRSFCDRGGGFASSDDGPACEISMMVIQVHFDNGAQGELGGCGGGFRQRDGSF